MWIKVYGKCEETAKNFKDVAYVLVKRLRNAIKISVRSSLEMKMRKGLCCSSVVKFYDLQ
jgi:hypothetical protein